MADLSSAASSSAIVGSAEGLGVAVLAGRDCVYLCVRRGAEKGGGEVGEVVGREVSEVEGESEVARSLAGETALFFDTGVLLALQGDGDELKGVDLRGTARIPPTSLSSLGGKGAILANDNSVVLLLVALSPS